ncbi:putative Structural maintenance of chromosomes protein 4 [Glarea lozoyensis 74030]|uniref:Structural maintenance of chromosomes protein n=1 Tax=Glarea lozoyensis (strain ATCC 74030 / MF5533) TaxID=1104152 RepID=H0ETW3_GLAL7|nr:putative Structural maintenance of chromosomes protein 4 [Glarea lozoyensis 74030]
MSETPARPSRRVAARRRMVVESDDEEDQIAQSQIKEESEEDFTPAPKKSPRKAPAPRRKTSNIVASTPRTVGRPKKSLANESIEPSEMFDAEQTMTPAPDSPTKKASPRKRKSVPIRGGRSSKTPELPPPLPTPQPSQSPEPSLLQGTPLADITASLNDRPRTADSQASAVKPIRALDTVLEKPMDIVLKSRSATAPVVEDTGPKARIVITYLILTNFKSYAGRQEVGPFHASFSSVVGPNGSGKSNVIDSLLFVFGFRASKMRQGKISALIHNSAAFPNLDFCEVAVHFQEVMDQPNGTPLIIPQSDLVISRRAFKNNSSKYYMNGKESNFTVVTTLLRDKGVDLDHKRFLILQGEVESIAQMKPKAANEHDDGLLEYLEDIIGTSKYKTPIEESATEVETLNEVCVEKSGRVQHVEKEKNGLEDKKNKALAYIKDENELTMKQCALYQVYINDCGDNLAVTEEAIGQMQAQLDSELEKHQGNEEGIKQLEKQYKKGQKEYDALDKDTQGILKEMAKFDQEHVKFEEKRKFLLNKQKKLEKGISTAESAATEAESTIESCSTEIEQSAKEIATMEKRMMAEEKELTIIRESLKGKTQAFSDKIASKQKSLEPWNEKINQKQSAIAVAESELAILHEKANAGAVALEETQAKLAVIEDGRKTKMVDLEKCKAERKVLEKEAAKVQKELDQLLQTEPELRSRLSGARQKADEARASLSNTQTQGNVLTGLMRLKESGRIEGFHGRLGNLGTIDKKYDIAISTACGALDNFVTDTVEGGQQCIEYLRKTNLGRGNFMCLDKLGSRDLSEIETPENVPRLFDLITAKDERFRAAFYYSLQNTLVAKDLAQANRIAYGAKRWRVVTLDGQLIDKSGTMSGGGNTVKKGLMSSKLVAEVSKEQVTKLEVDRDDLERDFQAFQDRQRELESQLRALNDDIPRLDTRMQKIGLEVESSAKNLADAQRRIKELSKEHQPSQTDDSRVDSLQKDINKLNKEIDNLRSETSSVEEEIKALQDKIMEVGGEKLRAQRAKVDAFKEEIAALNEALSTAEVTKAKAEKQKSKHEKDLSKASKELETAIADLESLEQDIKNQSSDAEGYQNRVDQAQESLREKKQELSTVKAELDEKTSALNETRAIEIEMRNKLEENQKVLAENQKRLRYWNDKLDKLALQNVSDLGEEITPEELPSYTKDELADMRKDSLKAEIAALEEKTQNVNVELGVLAEYRRRVEEHAARNADLQSAVGQRDTAKKRCDELRRLRLEGFMEGFSTISLRLKEMYQMITMGGNAELELVDSLDPFSEGILFSVMPPKKSWKNISNLSGGEKTLSSLALKQNKDYINGTA